MNKIVDDLLSACNLKNYAGVVNKIINAYAGFPDIDSPEDEIIKFLMLAQDSDIPNTELAIRFKHKLSDLSAYQNRLYKQIADGSIVFFNPFLTSYQDFVADTQEKQAHYQNINPYPTKDIALKHIEALVNHV